MARRYKRRKKLQLSFIECVILVIVGAILTWGYQIREFADPLASFGFNALTVGLGEAGVLYPIGYTLLRQLPRIKSFRDFVDKVNRK